MNPSNSWMTRQSSTIGDEISDVLMTKTKELFYMCDPTNKGYVTKEDLYRLKEELGLEDNEIENAFEQLDTDNDNYLTLEEFTTGFGLFLGVETTTNEMESDELKPDFVFQVFNLVDHDDKGYITKQDLIECSSTLEIELWQIDQLVEKLTTTSDVIQFDEFARHIESLIAISPALQEVKETEERRKMVAIKRTILAEVFKMDVSNEDDADVERTLSEQASALFKLCDHDNKSYVTREDILTLSDELTISHDRIMETFSNLDKNRHGYLTLREFINGFHSFFNRVTDNNVDYMNNENSSRYKKAEELFNLCDRDGKGYVTKQDLNCLITTVGLPEQQVLTIFHHLDADENGLISLDEFVNGFLEFPGDLCNESNLNESYNNSNEEVFENGFDEMYLTDCRSSVKNYSTPVRKPNMESESSSEDKNNSFLLRQPSVKYEHDLGEMIDKMEEEVGSAETTTQLKDLREIVCSSGDSMSVTMFEEFLGKVYSELKSAKEETKHLESVLERKSFSHNEEIKKIYEEMDNHLQNEKLKLQEIENRRESVILEDVQNELQEKQLELDKFVQRQVSLEERLEVVQEKEHLLKSENSELLKENVILESKLNTSIDHMESLRSNLHRMEEQTSLEKKETLRAAVQATQGLQHEHETLVRELDILRTTNEKLRDDRDALESSLKGKVRTTSWADELDGLNQKTKGPVQRTESVMSKYVQPSEPPKLCSKLLVSPASFGSKLSVSSDSFSSTESLTHGDRPCSTKSRKQLSKQGSVMSSYFEPVSDHVHSPISEDDDNIQPALFRSISVDEPVILTSIGQDEDKISSKVITPLEVNGNDSNTSQSNFRSVSANTLTNMGQDEDKISSKVITPLEVKGNDINTSQSKFRRVSVDEAPLALTTIGEDDVLEMDELDGSEVIGAKIQNQDSTIGEDGVLEMDELDGSEVIDSKIQMRDSSSSTPIHQRTPSSPRQTPVGMNAEDEVLDTISNLGSSPEHPSRLYKLVLVGDSCVGKSTFIHRFCFNAFKTFGATIGVDFQVKTMKINHEYIALQLWDTAGQERFRSLTKSYFRRADGVIVMFDLLSEESFLNVKGWMVNIEEGAESDCIVMLLGNKLDLVENDDSTRKISHKMASQLAKDYNAMYYEVSACSGFNVKESIEILARQLEATEDSRMNDSIVKLQAVNVPDKKKRKCCKS